MADFGFIPSSIKSKNLTSARKGLDNVMSKLATSNKMIADDANVRKTAINKYKTLKHTQKELAKASHANRSRFV